MQRDSNSFREDVSVPTEVELYVLDQIRSGVEIGFVEGRDARVLILSSGFVGPRMLCSEAADSRVSPRSARLDLAVASSTQRVFTPTG